MPPAVDVLTRPDAFTARLAELTSGTGPSSRVLRPADPDFDIARTPWQLSTDQRPAAVVQAASAADVVATVRAAAAVGLRVAPQTTGHNAGPLGPLDDTVLLRTEQLRGVTIDPVRRVARVEAGVVWGEVTAAAAAAGRVALAGSSAGVGVVGYTLGGGLSWLARRHGLAANQVVAAELVSADGELRRVDADHHPDLFWAVRGSGGNVGIVTALEFRLFPLVEVYAGALFWPIERAAEVLHTWRALLPALPDEITSVGRLLRLPPLPELPEPFRGRSFVVVELASLLDAAETEALIAPLQDLAPMLVTLDAIPPARLAELHMDPPLPTPATGDGQTLRELTGEALDALLGAVGPGAPTSFLSVELRHLGGALVPNPTAGGAVTGLIGAALLYAVAVTPDAAAVTRVETELDALAATVAPWAAEVMYRNFAERPRTPDAFHDGPTLARLRALRADYDPQGTIRSNHSV